jgi:hypothetical protein
MKMQRVIECADQQERCSYTVTSYTRSAKSNYQTKPLVKLLTRDNVMHFIYEMHLLNQADQI